MCFTEWRIASTLCHLGITRLALFIRVRNLPYSIGDIKRVVSTCQICCECKPQFYRPEPGHVVKATQPFERLNIDFKGPLPSNNQNKYILTVVDEYSRFPFVFPCRDYPLRVPLRHYHRYLLFTVCRLSSIPTGELLSWVANFESFRERKVFALLSYFPTFSADSKRRESLCPAFPISLHLVLALNVGKVFALPSLFPYI